jgi:hypothetical protein
VHVSNEERQAFHGRRKTLYLTNIDMRYLFECVTAKKQDQEFKNFQKQFFNSDQVKNVIKNTWIKYNNCGKKTFLA